MGMTHKMQLLRLLLCSSECHLWRIILRLHVILLFHCESLRRLSVQHQPATEPLCAESWPICQPNDKLRIHHTGSVALLACERSISYLVPSDTLT